MKVFLTVFLFLVAGAGQPVNAGQSDKTEITLSVDEGRPVFIHKNKKISCKGGSSRVDGCTRVLFYYSVVDAERFSDGGIKRLHLKVGLKKAEIELSSALEKGSCQFDLALKHELTHLALHRSILKRYASEMAKAALATVDSLPPSDASARMAKIKKVLDKLFQKLSEEDDRQNTLMDTDEAYRYQDRQCNG